MIKHGKKSLLILDALSKTSFAKHARTSPTAPHRTPPHPTPPIKKENQNKKEAKPSSSSSSSSSISLSWIFVL
jgi:hypothetical protein